MSNNNDKVTGSKVFEWKYDDLIRLNSMSEDFIKNYDFYDNGLLIDYLNEFIDNEDMLKKIDNIIKHCAYYLLSERHPVHYLYKYGIDDKIFNYLIYNMDYSCIKSVYSICNILDNMENNYSRVISDEKKSEYIAYLYTYISDIPNSHIFDAEYIPNWLYINTTLEHYEILKDIFGSINKYNFDRILSDKNIDIDTVKLIINDGLYKKEDIK